MGLRAVDWGCGLWVALQSWLRRGCPVRLEPAVARARFGAARVARLASVAADGTPHLVPVVFVLDGDTIWTAVDGKPKSGEPLRRLTNMSVNPRVVVLVDEYAEDWSALWWARADGLARLYEAGDPQAQPGISALRQRYPQYTDVAITGPLIAVAVHRWSGWSAGPTT